MKRASVLVVAALLAGAGGLSTADAVSNVLNLGKITNIGGRGHDMISGFHRVSVNVAQFGRPELLLLVPKTQNAVDQVTAMETWPVVKALEQFGSLSHVKVVDKNCKTMKVGPFPPAPMCNTPAFNLSHATYNSRYLRFATRALVPPPPHARRNQQWKPSPGFSAVERTVFEKYLCKPGHKFCEHNFNPPAVAIGRYLETTSYKLFAADFSAPAPTSATPNATPGPDLTYYTRIYNFATLHQALLNDRDPNPGLTPVEDINGEANVMIGLICAQDGGKPATVCGRSAIRAISKAAK